MEITVNDVNITLTPEQIAQICKEANEDKPKFTYPIFKRSIKNKQVVKFTSLTDGEVVWRGDKSTSNPVGTKSGFFNHTDTDIWQDVAYDAEHDLWDGQPVYAWDNFYTHTCVIGFYDTVNKGIFTHSNKRGGCRYHHYEAIDPSNYTPWMLEAFNTLQR